MEEIYTISIKIAITISLLVLSLPTTKANVLEGACKGNQQCLAIFNQDPKASTAKDVRELCEIGLHVAIANTTKSQKFTQRLADRTSEPKLKAQLVSCAEAFGEASDQFRMAVRELGDPESASYDAFVACDGPGYCREGLQNNGFKVDSVLSRVGYVFTYSRVINDVIDQIS